MLVFCYSLTFWYFVHPATTAPLPLNETEFISWKSTPNTRGTWEILQTCVITLTLCVYTAVHLNVPGTGETRKKKTLRRTIWTLLGILTPEIVLFYAWKQFYCARQMTKAMAELAKKNGIPQSHACHDWTLTHSFFACMGGFVIDQSLTASDGRPTSVNWRSYLSGLFRNKAKNSQAPSSKLSLDGDSVLSLARYGNDIPLMTNQAILDHSKADALSKTLACVQASFILVQTIGRLAQKLTITTLEINTIGHVLCALVMYVFWYRKPLNVEEPVKLGGLSVERLARIGPLNAENEDTVGLVSFQDETTMLDNGFRVVSALCVYLQTLSKSVKFRDDEWMAHLQHNLNEFCFWRKPIEPSEPSEFDKVVLGPWSEVIVCGLPKSLPKYGVDICVVLYCVPSQITDMECKKALGCFKFWNSTVTHIYRSEETRYKVANSIRKSYEGPDYGNGPYRPTCLLVNFTGIEQWTRAFEILSEDPIPGTRFLRSASIKWQLRRRIPENISGIELPRDQKLFAALVLFFVSAAYGGLHATLWTSHFPTNTERWLWRCSALTVGATLLVPFSALLFFAMTHMDWIRRMVFAVAEGFYHFMEMIGVDWVVIMVGCVVIFAFALCYIAARSFIVIEAFIALRSLPPSAYETPDWISWLPHL